MDHANSQEEDSIDGNKSQALHMPKSASQVEHHRSSSLDSPPPKSKMDPTGMFRNRGRRTIRTSAQNGVLTSSQSSSSLSQSSSSSLSPVKNYKRHGGPPPTSPTTQQQQGKYRSRYEHATTTLMSSSAQSTAQNSGTSDDVIGEGSHHSSHHMNQTLQREQERIISKDNQVDMNSMQNNINTERIIYEEEPENYHPPQSTLPSDREDQITTTQQYNIDNNIDAQSIENNEEPTQSDENNMQLNASNIIMNRSQDSINDSINSSEQYAHSAVGSTVSIMGSIVGEEEGDDDGINETRLLAVKRRMMQDVQEVLEEEDQDEESEGANAEDAMHSTDTLNTSLECNADTDTALLEDIDPTYHETDANSDQDVDNRQSEKSNVVKVADFSDKDNLGIDDKYTINNIIYDTTTTTHESPLRAAFRRSAQGMANHLPPLSSSSGTSGSPFKRLTPNRFQRATASSAIDKAATTASLIPQLARQCFSFEDTTVDDDHFLAMPDQLHNINIGSGEGGQQQLATHKYYGLSAVASIDDCTTEQSHRNYAPKWYPPNRTRLSNNGEHGNNPFRVIRHSQTWDPDGRPSSMRKYSNDKRKETSNYFEGSLRQTSSFDPWSPQLSSGRVKPLGNKIEQFPISEALDSTTQRLDNEKKDWKVSFDCILSLSFYLGE